MTIQPLPLSKIHTATTANMTVADGHVQSEAGTLQPPSRQPLLALIGELNLNWSNNESLFIYVIKALLKTDEVSAAIVFATLNTTRSRLDLISRLGKLRLKASPLQRELKAIVQEFLAHTRFRNELSHSTYVSGPEGDITHTQSTKLDERGGALIFGARRMIDEKRITEIAHEIASLKTLNQRIWALIHALNI